MTKQCKTTSQCSSYIQNGNKGKRGVPKWSGGSEIPYCDFGWAVLTEEMLLRKTKKLPEFLLQNIASLRTSNCDAG